MPLIAFGQIDKKLILMIFLIIVWTIKIIIANEVPGEYKNEIIYSFSLEVGAIVAGVILIFVIKQKQKKVDIKKRNFIYILILFSLRIIQSCYEIIYPYFLKEGEYDYGAILNTTNGFKIILLSFGTFILLKYKYYIHHYISMIIFCVLGIVVDYILKTYSLLNYKYLYFDIIYHLNEVMVICYLKYMMDKLYYQYMEVIIYWGIIGVLHRFIIFMGLILYEYKNNINGYLLGIHSYFTETNIFIIIFFQFFYCVIDGGIYYIIVFLICYYLKPNYIIVAVELYVYEQLILYQDLPNKFYTLIPFAFQMVALLFYFEILEFNFFGLNKNTSKNIKRREKRDNSERNDSLDCNTIELTDQYYLKDNELENANEEQLALDNDQNKINSLNKENIL